jgi:hypothetical protein
MIEAMGGKVAGSVSKKTRLRGRRCRGRLQARQGAGARASAILDEDGNRGVCARVMLDADLNETDTNAFDANEKSEVVANCDHLGQLKYSLATLRMIAPAAASQHPLFMGEQ